MTARRIIHDSERVELDIILPAEADSINDSREKDARPDGVFSSI